MPSLLAFKSAGECGANDKCIQCGGTEPSAVCHRKEKQLSALGPTNWAVGKVFLFSSAVQSIVW